MTAGRFGLALAGLCLLYAAIETLYVLRLPLVMDEFQGARAVHALTEGMPYRDFTPYKTVLGYYLQLPALGLPGSSWQKLMAVKLEMVVLNMLALGAASLLLARRFDRRAVLAGLALLVTMSTFLERSPDLRVDMPTAIAGLFSLLLLIERRHLAAGIVCGLSFLISQKGAYYAIAGNVALGGWLLVARDRAAARGLLAFNLAAAVTAAAYFGFWSLAATPARVFSSAVGDAGRIAVDFIEDIRLRYWGRTVRFNPLFYGLALGALWHLDRRRRDRAAGRVEWELLLYGSSLSLLCVLHHQPWPYFFVLLIPTLWVLIVALLDGRMASWRALDRRRRAWLAAGFVALGIVYPLTRLPANLGRDSGFQRQMIELAEAALAPGETYLAGVDLLWHRRQVDDRLAWLDRLQLARLGRMAPGELAELLRELEAKPLKLIVDSYRIQQLPRPLREALGRRYAFYWGNLMLYSPIVEAEADRFELAIGGDYLVLVEQGAANADPGTIDGRPIAAGGTLRLAAGTHLRSGSGRIRLRLAAPELDALRDPRYRERRPLFPDVYDY